MKSVLSQWFSKGIKMLLILLIAFNNASFADESLEQAPNDFVIQEIIKLHKDPKGVMSELQQALNKAPSPVRQAEIHYLLALGHNKLNDNAKALHTILQAKSLAQPLDEPLLHNRILLTQAKILDSVGRPEEALPLANAVSKWANAKNIKQLYIGSLLTSGLLETSLQQYDKALELLTLAYEQANQFKTKINPSHVASLIADVYLVKGSSEKAIPFYEEAIEFAEKRGNKLIQKRYLFGLGQAYQNNKDLNQALSSFSQALDLAKDLNDEVGVAESYIKIAEVSLDNDDFENAIVNYLKGQEIIKEHSSSFLQFSLNIGLAKAFYQVKNYSLAQEYLQNAKVYVDGVSMEEHDVYATELQADILYAQGKSSDAFLSLKSALEKKEKLLVKRNNEKLLELRTKFENAKKEAENVELRRQNQEQEVQIFKQEIQTTAIFITLLAAICLSILLIIIVIKSRNYQRRLERVVNYDALTSLCSRKFILEQLKQKITESEQNQKPLTVAMIDLDFFKKINDQFGHPTGDSVLRFFGESAQRFFGEDVAKGRIGGEEFLFVFDNQTYSEAFEALEHFRKEVKLIPQAIEQEGLKLTISAGLVEFSSQDTVSALLSKSDQALYKAKTLGRDRIVKYHSM